MTKAKFLAFSLPFGLKCTGATEIHKYNLLSVHIGSIDLCRVKPIEGGIDFPLPVNDIKPILRPLSDLTKEIEQNGEKFVPIDKILEEACFDLSKMNRDEINSYSNPILMPELISLTDALMLIEWHFDLAGLIERDEAININNLVSFHY